MFHEKFCHRVQECEQNCHDRDVAEDRPNECFGHGHLEYAYCKRDGATDFQDGEHSHPKSDENMKKLFGHATRLDALADTDNVEFAEGSVSNFYTISRGWGNLKVVPLFSPLSSAVFGLFVRSCVYKNCTVFCEFSGF